MASIKAAFTFIDAELNDDADSRPVFSERDPKWGFYTIKFLDKGIVALHLLDRNITIYWMKYADMQRDIESNYWHRMFTYSPIDPLKIMDASYLPCSITAKLLRL